MSRELFLRSGLRLSRFRAVCAVRLHPAARRVHWTAPLRPLATHRSFASACLPRSMSTCPAPAPRERYELLPDYAVPTHYALRLEPDLSSFTFKGRVDVTLDITRPTSALKLHAHELRFDQISLKLANGQVLDRLTHACSEKTQLATVALPCDISPQKAAVLSINYTGIHNDVMAGFYRSKYTAENGADEYLVSSHFESTHARKAFPCWDEPLFKATFDVTLVVDEGLTAISNEAVISDVVEGKKRVVKFATTPKMSTYLVAFATGKFEYLEATNKSGVKVRVYTVPGKKELGAFSLDCATKALDWFAEWFSVPYALKKCDLIGIPDFKFAAMENWGLVTFREISVLVDPKKTSSRTRKDVALTVSHELAHLWFGDLVTMKWWTDLWLKEGFASFMEYLFVSYNYPEMKVWLHFLNDEVESGLDLDSLRSSHPIEVPIDNPNELEEIYDSITYAKSNCVNRMLCSYLGEETFQKGLVTYLKRFAFSNAVTKDLWSALSEASGQDIVALMHPWTSQMGFPVVSVSVSKSDGDKKTLVFEQKRFVSDGSDDPTNPLWQVPITITRAGQPDAPFHRFVLKERRQEVEITVPASEWIKVNHNTTGFYRVRYSEDLIKPLLAAVADRSLSVLDRFGLCSDVFALFKAGQIALPQFLSLLEASNKETEYTVWRTLDLGIATLASVLDYHTDSSLKDRFSKYAISNLTAAAERLGWDVPVGEDSQVSLLRGLIQGRLCRLGHEPAKAKAAELFAAYFAENKQIHADLRAAVFNSAIKWGGDKEYDQLVAHFEKCGLAEIERAALIALSLSDPKSGRLEKLFDYGIKNGKVRNQDLSLLFFGGLASSAGQAFMFNYFKNNIPLLKERFGGAGEMHFQRSLKFSTEGSCSEKLADAIATDLCGKLDSVELATLDRPIKQSAERIRNNAKILASTTSYLDAYLKQRGF